MSDKKDVDDHSPPINGGKAEALPKTVISRDSSQLKFPFLAGIERGEKSVVIGFPDKPRDILSQLFHGVDPLIVCLDVARQETLRVVPVSRSGREHPADAEVMVDTVHGADRPGSPLSRKGGAELLPKHIVVCLCHEKRPVHECLDLRGDSSKMRRGPDDDSIGLKHLFDAFVHHVFLLDALPVPILKTFPASDARMDFFPANLDEFSFYPSSLDRVQRVPDQEVRIAVPVGTAIECNDFHRFFSTESIRFGIVSVVSII